MQTQPIESFKIQTIAGHRYKVLTKYNWMLFVFFKKELTKRLQKQVLEKLKVSDEYSPEQVDMETVAEWSKNLSSDDPIYFEAFFDVICKPLDGAPPVSENLLYIEPETLQGFMDFFQKWNQQEGVIPQNKPKHTKPSKKAGAGRKQGSRSRTTQASTPPSSTEGS